MEEKKRRTPRHVHNTYARCLSIGYNLNKTRRFYGRIYAIVQDITINKTEQKISEKSSERAPLSPSEQSSDHRSFIYSSGAGEDAMAAYRISGGILNF